MPEPIITSALGLDLSPRVTHSSTVAASPTDATETTICTLTLPGDPTIVAGVLLFGFAAFTVGTTGNAANLKIRQTDTSGTTIVATGATNTGALAATQLTSLAVVSFDTAPSATGQVYVLTLTVGAATAGSTVSAAELVAIAI
jgi:hypothetical protein